MLNGQFILTKYLLSNPKLQIGDYYLYYKDIELTVYKSEFTGTELYLLGFLYDWQFPYLSNYDILRNISAYYFPSDILDKYSGHFVLIYKTAKQLIIINDCCSQYHLFYDNKFRVFASQPKLIDKVIDCKLRNDYYMSDRFKGFYVGDETQYTNIRQLMPNHYLDVQGKNTIRFFPRWKSEKNPLSFVALKAIEMIKGYIKAAAYRKKLAVTLTGGYDTRILFGATKDIDCDYFTLKTDYMTSWHPDIKIPLKIIEKYKKDLKIISTDRVKISDHKDIYGDTIRDFTDYPYLIFEDFKDFKDHQVVMGSLSEVFRGFWDNYYFVSPKLLACLAGNNQTNIYSKWLSENESLFRNCGYNIFDMFFWEERCVNFISKINKILWMNHDVWNVFNSRDLICLLLSADKKFRDYDKNILYDEMIGYMTPEFIKIPVNPYFKGRIIKLMKVLRIYKIYKHIQYLMK